MPSFESQSCTVTMSQGAVEEKTLLDRFRLCGYLVFVPHCETCYNRVIFVANLLSGKRWCFFSFLRLL